MDQERNLEADRRVQTTTDAPLEILIPLSIRSTAPQHMVFVVPPSSK